MLDQNTDRMWYVIGAVLVGAAIILIANGTLPQMFASVTQSFENVSNNAIEGVSRIGEKPIDEEELAYVNEIKQRHMAAPNLADPSRFMGQLGGEYIYDSVTGISKLKIPVESNSRDKGARPHNGINVSPGQRVTISFEMYAEKDTPIYFDFNTVASGLSGNDHRLAPKFNSLGNKQGKHLNVVGGEWTEYFLSYIPNTSSSVFQEQSAWVYASNDYSEDIEFSIRDMKWTVTDDTLQ